MKDNYTHIEMLLDRSGSMEPIRDDTIGGVNAFTEKQAAVPGECTMSLNQFDDQYETNYEFIAIKSVPKLNRDTYIPRGATALVDSMARMIQSAKTRLMSIPDALKPSKVIIVVVTDGGENASRQYTRTALADMIKLMRDEYKWEFVFLGANQDAIMTAAAYNIPAHSAATYVSTGIGTRTAFNTVSESIGASRVYGTAVMFNDEQRKNLIDADDGYTVKVTTTTDVKIP